MTLSQRLASVMVVAPALLMAQRIENVKATVVGDHIVVTYDINGADPGTKFKTSLYSSHNNFSAALTHVTGDVGEVTAGPGKRIDWNARAELQTYSGELSFEVRGVPVFIPWTFKTPSGGEALKTGKATVIGWAGGQPSESVQIELLRNGNVLQRIGTAPNSGTYRWDVPKSIEKGGGYQVRVTSGNNGATSESFTVKKPPSPLIFIAPVVVGGGVAAALLLGGGGEETTDLPFPPDVPTNP